MAWVLALGGSLISLYYGEVLLIEPCPLCWYQRLSWFPLAVILGIGVYHDDFRCIRYSLLFAWFGLIISFYHALISHFPALSLCGSDCTNSFFSFLPWLSFPDVSFVGLLVITILLYKAKSAPVSLS